MTAAVPLEAAIPGAAAPPADPAPPRPAAMDPRTNRLLHGPILPTLLRLAWPNVLVMVMQSSVGMIEAYFVGKLGTDPLAGVALVFPLMMLMTMMSAGAVGGGISSSIARSLGAGRPHDAERFALHAMAISGAIGVFCSVLFLWFGRDIYRLMGGQGAALEAACTYSAWVFGGMVLTWSFNGLSSILRGTGNMIVPSIVICVGTLLLIPLSPALIFGWGPFPRLGIAGGGAAVIAYYAGGNLALVWYLATGRSVVRLRGSALRWRYMRDILRVGGVGALNTVQTNGTIAIVTALFSVYGASAIAAYGVASRLEYLQIPLGFGIGAPLVAIIGTNLGAGQVERAYRAAWIGVAVGFCVSGGIGVLAAYFAETWMALFDPSPDVVATGARYLRVVAPFYGFFGSAIVLNLASQGAQRVMWPFIAGSARLIVTAGGGMIAVTFFAASLGPVAILVACGMTVMGGINIASVLARTWTNRNPRAA